MTKVCAYSSGPNGALSRNPSTQGCLQKLPASVGGSEEPQKQQGELGSGGTWLGREKPTNGGGGHPESKELAHWLTGTL